MERFSYTSIHIHWVIFGILVVEVVESDVSQIAELGIDIANVLSLMEETTSVPIRDVGILPMDVLPLYIKSLQLIMIGCRQRYKLHPIGQLH